MEGAKRISLGARKKSSRKKRRRVRNIAAYLRSDEYLFAPLFSNSPPLVAGQIQTHSPSNSESFKAGDVSIAGFETLGTEKVNKKKRRMSEKVKEYLNSDYHMYGPIISPTKFCSSLKGKLQITKMVTMKVSTSTTTVREGNNNYKNLRSERRRTGLNREKDLSPALSNLPEGKMAKVNQTRVTIE